MTVRGNQASGYAFHTADNASGYYKEDVSGSHLRLKGLPRHADTVILHTRMATHGDTADMRNNHPIISQSGKTRLVHNGVIWNHDDLREDYKLNSLPEVDSSVIPEIIEVGGPDETSNLAGDAAIAWLSTETGNMLHLARVTGNPIAFTWLADGSFVFASTGSILGYALAQSGLSWVTSTYPGAFQEFKDTDYVQIQDGEVVLARALPESLGWDYYTGRERSGWRSITSGKSSKNAAWSEDDIIEMDEAAYERWWNERPSEDGDHPRYVEPDNYPGASQSDVFYTLDHNGDYQGYPDIEVLGNVLAWHAGLSTGADGFENVTGEIRWIAHFSDVGMVTEDGRLHSFLEYPDMTWEFETGYNGGLEFIREGASELKKLVGA